MSKSNENFHYQKLAELLNLQNHNLSVRIAFIDFLIDLAYIYFSLDN